MNRDAVLFHQQKFLFRSHGGDESGAGRIDPVNVFPTTFSDQSQEFAGVKCGCVDLVHFVFKILAL
ncbi:MAG: hypothetical protein WDN00_17515 [Limisphaerales bacterium]